MSKLIKTHHRTYNLLQNVASISGDFHTHKLCHCFYDTFGKYIDGFIGNYDICIEMARALTDWETANGGSGIRSTFTTWPSGASAKLSKRPTTRAHGTRSQAATFWRHRSMP